MPITCEQFLSKGQQEGLFIVTRETALFLERTALLGRLSVIPCPVLIINFKKEKQMLLSFFNWITRDTFCRTFWLLRQLRNYKIWCTPDTGGFHPSRDDSLILLLIALLEFQLVSSSSPLSLVLCLALLCVQNIEIFNGFYRMHGFRKSSSPGISFVIFVKILTDVECGIMVLSNTWPGCYEVMFILIDTWYSFHEENYHPNRLLISQIEHRSLW